VFEEVSKTGPSRNLVLRAYVIPNLNVDHGRLVVLHKAGFETIGESHRPDSRMREGDGFANPVEKEKKGCGDHGVRQADWMEDARQLAANLKRPLP
jgi:hypothetical protein